MSFTSLQFWFLFPLIFVFYWAIPSKLNTLRKVLLLVVSYLLYMNWKPAFALVLLGVTLVTYGGGYLIGFQQVINKRKSIVWLFALLGLLPLLLFKYYNFINNSLTDGLAAIGLKFSMPGLNWAIPVGISFFTFQAVGYMLDVYHGRVKAEKNLLDYLLFVSFFPQVMSGPISKADELLPQIKSEHNFNYSQGVQGLKYLLWGLFLKIALADRLGIYVDKVFLSFEHYDWSICATASVFYSLQIYGDFAGYSLMAVGVAELFGFNLINNFRQPYLATSITDFWRRWHISLTRWLTQQIYIPLGGSRCSKAKTFWNIFVTFLVSGIWHGANWTFIVWGCLHGLFQIVEKALGLQKYEGKNWCLKVFRICVTFLLVSFAWIFFRSPSIGVAFGFIGRMFTLASGSVDTGGMTNMIIILLMIAIMVLNEVREEWLKGKIRLFKNPVVKMAVYVILFAIVISLGCLDGGQFIYVSF